MKTGEIYVGLNTGPASRTTLIQARIDEQIDRIATGEVHIIHDIAPGEHAEINALDSALAAREARTGKPVTDVDLSGFEVHNVWLQGQERTLTTAARCEHCAHITRGVAVTNSLFHEEGGVSGEIQVTATAPPEPTEGSISGGGSKPGGQRTKGTTPPASAVQEPVHITPPKVPSGAARPQASKIPSSGTVANERVTIGYDLDTTHGPNALKIKNLNLDDYPPDRVGRSADSFKTKPCSRAWARPRSTLVSTI